MILGVDPGANSYAWAFVDGGKVLACGMAIVGQPIERPQLAGSYPLYVVIELPQVYRQSHWKGDPNDLIRVAVTVGRVQAWIEHAFRGVLGRVNLVKPHDWKGSRPKAVHCRSILAKLDPESLDRLEACGVAESLKHNVVDAIGLALWGEQAICGKTPRQF